MVTLSVQEIRSIVKLENTDKTNIHTDRVQTGSK